MTTAIGITLLVGFGLGVVFGFPAGRTWERLRPRPKPAGRQDGKRR